MSPVRSVTIQWKRSLEIVHRTETLPVYLSWSTETQLTASNAQPENGLFDYCIEIDQQRQTAVIRPQDAHFDLFLQKANGQILQVIRPLSIDDGDGLGIDEARGMEWLVRIDQQKPGFEKEPASVASAPIESQHTSTAVPRSKATPPPTGRLKLEIWFICTISLAILSAVLWFGLS